jgi:hypothetical protein
MLLMNAYNMFLIKKILLIAEQDFFVDKFWSKLSERRERDTPLGYVNQQVKLLKC